MTKDLHYSEQDILKGTIGGLGAICGTLLLFIKNYAVKLIKKRNNDIELRLTLLEKGQESLMSKLREVNHVVKNNDKNDAGAFQLVLDKLEDLEKRENGVIIELYKTIDNLKFSKNGK